MSGSSIWRSRLPKLPARRPSRQGFGRPTRVAKFIYPSKDRRFRLKVQVPGETDKQEIDCEFIELDSEELAGIRGASAVPFW